MLPKHINNDCRKFREMISSYLDGQITQDEKQALEFHLVSCCECREEWESLRATKGLLHRLPQAEVPRSFTVADSKPAAVPSIFGRLCWASAIVAMILVLFSAGDLFHVYPEKSNGPSGKIAMKATSTPAPTPSSTFTPGFPGIGKDFGLQTGTPPSDIPPMLSAQGGSTPIPGQTAGGLVFPPIVPSSTPVESNTTATTEATKEGYRWPVHQIELAVLGVAMVMMTAVIIVWRRGEGSSTKGR